MIQERFAQGVYVKDIAAELGVHPRTISRALRCSGAPSGRRPAARKSKLDPYQPMIDQLLDQGVRAGPPSGLVGGDPAHGRAAAA